MVYDVRDYWVTGDGVTDDVAALNDLGRKVSAAGGGTLLFPPGTYAVSRPIYCYSNVKYVGDAATIKNVSNHPFLPGIRAAFVPGALWSRGFKAANGTDAFPYHEAQDVARGSRRVTAAAAGGFAGINPGDFVVARSRAHYLEGTGEMPYQMFFSKVTGADGDTLILADASPYTLTGAALHHLNSTPDHGPTEGAGIHQYVAENITITGFGVDAENIFWGGGAYRATITDLHPVGRAAFSSLITLNAMLHTTFERVHGGFYRQFCELKLGSADTVVRDCAGTYTPGPSMGVPVNFGESAHNIRFRDNTVHITNEFQGGRYPIVDFTHCQDIRVQDNTISVAGKCDNIFYIGGGATTNPGDRAQDVHITGNNVHCTGGANRYLLVGAKTTASPPARVIATGNILTGTSSIHVGEWLNVQTGEDLVIRDNIVPPGLRENRP